MTTRALFLVDALSVAAFIIYILILIYLQWSYPRRVRDFFSQFSHNQGCVEKVRGQLAILNREFKYFDFGFDQMTCLNLRGRSIVVIYGKVGQFVTGTQASPWTQKRCVYSIIDANMSKWITDNADIFELVLTGGSSSICWVKFENLKRELRRHPET